MPLKLQDVTKAKIQLGGPETPVYSAPIYAMLSMDYFLPLLNKLSSPKELRISTYLSSDGLENRVGKLRVKAPDQAFYTMLSNEAYSSTKTYSTFSYALWTGIVSHGVLTAPLQDTEGHTARIVNTPQELLAASAKQQYALLVYRLDAPDLRHLKFTPVQASELQR